MAVGVALARRPIDRALRAIAYCQTRHIRYVQQTPSHVQTLTSTGVTIEPKASSQPTFAARSQRLMHAFLPDGYPNSVNPTFAAYCKWQFAHMATQTAAGVLSMQALLYGAGLGAGALPLAAAINWVLKDGLGQLGGVLYGTLFGTKFDHDPKRQRYLALVALQSANFLELLTPLVPSLFLPLASLANVAKNVSFLTSSATRAQIHASFVRQANLGDVTAKIGSQSIAASVVGTGLGIVCSTWTGTDTWMIMSAFVPLAAASVALNNVSMRYVELPHFDGQRLDVFAKLYLEHPQSQVPSPKEVAAREVFLHPYQPWHEGRLLVEPSLATVSQVVGKELNNQLAQHSYNGYTLLAHDDKAYLWFHTHASTASKVAGYVHAAAMLQSSPSGPIAIDKTALIAAGWDLSAFHVHGEGALDVSTS